MHLDHLNWVPFVGLLAGNTSSRRPFVTRLVEQSLPGIFVAAAGLYVNDKIQDERIGNLLQRQEEMATVIRDRIAAIEVDVHEIKRDLYAPKRR